MHFLEVRDGVLFFPMGLIYYLVQIRNIWERIRKKEKEKPVLQTV